MTFVKFNPYFNPWIVLIELRGTEFNRRTNLFRGLGRLNRGLALIGFLSPCGTVTKLNALLLNFLDEKRCQKEKINIRYCMAGKVENKKIRGI